MASWWTDTIGMQPLSCGWAEHSSLACLWLSSGAINQREADIIDNCLIDTKIIILEKGKIDGKYKRT